eukprot:GHVT01053159.1.p1 GENE.GHVT01053159.1~~GHVT01053159.1.p1  ORF type:complete len:504 (-),score=11.43 GHVT01053159.1:912-2423(-)
MPTEERHASNIWTPANRLNPVTARPTIFVPSTSDSLHTTPAHNDLQTTSWSHPHNQSSSHLLNQSSKYSHKPSRYSHKVPIYSLSKRLSVESCPRQVLDKCLTGKIVDQGELLQCIVHGCHGYTNKHHGGPQAAAACGVHCFNEASTGTCSLAEMTTCGVLCPLGICECSCRDPFCGPRCGGPTCKEQDLELCETYFNCTSSCSCSCKDQNCSVSCGDCDPEEQADCNSRCGVPCPCTCSNAKCTATCPSAFQCRNAEDCETRCLEPCQCFCAGNTCTSACSSPTCSSIELSECNAKCVDGQCSCDFNEISYMPVCSLCSSSITLDCTKRCDKSCDCECVDNECESDCTGPNGCDNPIGNFCLGTCGSGSCTCFCKSDEPCLKICSNCASQPCSGDCICNCLSGGGCILGSVDRCPVCNDGQFCNCQDDGRTCTCIPNIGDCNSNFPCTCENQLPCACIRGVPQCQPDLCILKDEEACIERCGDACQCVCTSIFQCEYACVTS